MRVFIVMLTGRVEETSQFRSFSREIELIELCRAYIITIKHERSEPNFNKRFRESQ